jgi:hypothetical protein
MSLGTPHTLHGLRLLVRLAKIHRHARRACQPKAIPTPNGIGPHVATASRTIYAPRPSTDTHADEVGSDE